MHATAAGAAGAGRDSRPPPPPPPPRDTGDVNAWARDRLAKFRSQRSQWQERPARPGASDAAALEGQPQPVWAQHLKWVKSLVSEAAARCSGSTLRSLCLVDHGFGPEALACLAVAIDWSLLEELDLSSTRAAQCRSSSGGPASTSEDPRLLFPPGATKGSCNRLFGVVSRDRDGNPPWVHAVDTDMHGWKTLLDAIGRCTALKVLRCADCGIGPQALGELASSMLSRGGWRGVVELDLGRNSLTGAGLDWLSASPCPASQYKAASADTALLHDTWGPTHVQRGGAIRALAAAVSTCCPRLEVLRLRGAGIGTHGLGMLLDGLASSFSRHSCLVLDLLGNPIGAAGVEKLAEWLSLGSGGSGGGDYGYRSACGLRPGQTALDLTNAALHPMDLHLLSAELRLQCRRRGRGAAVALTELDLGGNPALCGRLNIIGALDTHGWDHELSGLRELCSCIATGQASGLRTLGLANTGIGQEGLKELRAALEDERCQSLTSLDLRGCSPVSWCKPVSDTSIRVRSNSVGALLQGPASWRLRELVVDNIHCLFESVPEAEAAVSGSWLRKLLDADSSSLMKSALQTRSCYWRWLRARHRLTAIAALDAVLAHGDFETIGVVIRYLEEAEGKGCVMQRRVDATLQTMAAQDVQADTVTATAFLRRTRMALPITNSSAPPAVTHEKPPRVAADNQGRDDEPAAELASTRSVAQEAIHTAAMLIRNESAEHRRQAEMAGAEAAQLTDEAAATSAAIREMAREVQSMLAELDELGLV
eukprot:SAG22_NODE_8_length_37215_cov_120.960351_23_plen_766_part_00